MQLLTKESESGPRCDNDLEHLIKKSLSNVFFAKGIYTKKPHIKEILFNFSF